MSQSYQTVAQNASAELIIERSRFISFCYEISTEAEAKDIIQQLRAEHAQASHNCFAYRIGPGVHPLEYFNDHGEPSGTAGKPILGAIQRLGLTNVIVVVTRYFGGKKLGVRGLIDAYGETATLVLEKAGVITRIPKFTATLVYDYPSHNIILHRLHQVGAEIMATDFAEKITLTLLIPEENRNLFGILISELPGIKA